MQILGKGCESTEEVITYMAGFDEQLPAFEANTKVEDCVRVIRMINYCFKYNPIFFLLPSSHLLLSNQRRCVQNSRCDLVESVL